MKDLTNLDFQRHADDLRSLRAERADANDPLRVEQLHVLAQVIVTSAEQRQSLGRGQFVRCAIAAALLDKGQRTIVRDKVILKEDCGRLETICEKFPQPAPAHF